MASRPSTRRFSRAPYRGGGLPGGIGLLPLYPSCFARLPRQLYGARLLEGDDVRLAPAVRFHGRVPRSERQMLTSDGRLICAPLPRSQRERDVRGDLQQRVLRRRTARASTGAFGLRLRRRRDPLPELPAEPLLLHRRTLRLRRPRRRRVRLECAPNACADSCTRFTFQSPCCRAWKTSVRVPGSVRRRMPVTLTH